MESFLIHTDIQKKWIRKFKKIESEFKARAAENDIQSRFPYENIEWLIKEGYTKLTL
ncbi:MAG: acyl-CoA dehydrogenase, partial [Staphylococcus epidermidis]|nr:acyl-CoA dehydrogenase [Staphylococcus epidermidis]